MEYANFTFYLAEYWGVSSTTFYKVNRYSNSRNSVYLEMNGRLRMVPVNVLEFTTILGI